jgi:hypothetical protein
MGADVWAAYGEAELLREATINGDAIGPLVRVMVSEGLYRCLHSRDVLMIRLRCT